MAAFCWTASTACAISIFASLTGASAADLQLKAPALQELQPPDAVPMFGDFQNLDSDGNVRRGGFKISENESVRPVDRVFINYNYYSGVDTGTQTVNVHRETLGFEKTFLDGNASFGMRLPFLQNLDDKSGIGDVTLIGKYAFINDRATGNVVSAGLAVTVPTGDFSMGFDFSRNQNIHSTVIQPFVGAYRTLSGPLFVQGFSSLAIPTDSRDATYWFNSVGVGYWLYRSGSPILAITGVIPTLEVHFNTPINHQGDGAPQRLDTIVNITAGVHVELYRHAMLGFSIGTPLTGPRPYDVEAITSFNFRF